MVVEIITKLPEFGDLCGNITEFGVAEGFYLSSQGEADPPPSQTKWYCHTDLQMKVVKMFYILLFNDFMSFPAKVLGIWEKYEFITVFII